MLSAKPVWRVYGLVLAAIALSSLQADADPTGQFTCQYQEAYHRYVSQIYHQHYTTTCGWLGWNRCGRYRIASRAVLQLAYRTRRYCCSGSRLNFVGTTCVKDCSVGNWGTWGGCSESCYSGGQYRYRSIVVYPVGGNSCPWTYDYQSCNTHLTGCDIGSRCYTNNYINTYNCGYCDNRVSTRRAWQPQSGAACNDGNTCTKNDVCRSGRCSGTTYSCSSCENCNGVGCTVQSGKCRIQNTCYSAGTANPSSPQCQSCTSSSRTSWTNRPAGTRCTDGNDCTRNDACDANGQCQPGYNYEHECVKPCQACSSGGTCATTRGCVLNGKCGCSIGGQCYADRQERPGQQCYECNFALNPTGWSKKADGATCSDNNVCTHRDDCVSGTCRGIAYLCNIGGPCMQRNTCNGKGGCVPTFYGSSQICYRQQDACDHANTACTGTLAACPVTSLKLLTGTPIVLGQMSLRSPANAVLPTGPVNHFNLVFQAALLTSSTSVSLHLTGYNVPCGTVSYSVVLYRLTQSTSIASGGQVVTLSNGQTTLTTQSAPLATKTVTVSAAFQQNSVYRIQLTAKNVRGNSLAHVSSPLLVDITPPHLTSGIYDGSKPSSAPYNKDIAYQLSRSSLTIHWIVPDLRDLESGLDLNSFQMAVGTTAKSDNVKSYQSCLTADIGKGQCSVTSLSLQNGVRYYSTLRVRNKAGAYASFSSNGVITDNTPPQTGQLVLTLPNSLSNNDKVLSKRNLQFGGELRNTADQQSGIQSVAWQLCDTTSSPTVCSTQGFQDIACSSFPCQLTMVQPSDRITTAIGLIDDHTYEVQIRVTNRVGLTSIAKDNFRVDLSPPIAGKVSDGASMDLQFQSSLTTLQANWNGFSDTGTGLHHYEWTAYVFTDTTTALFSYENVALRLSGTRSSLSLKHSVKYKVCVKAVDNADNSVIKCSNGVTVDSKQPTGGVVLDLQPSGGSLIDIDYQADPSRLRVRWQGFTALSGIKSYSLGIGTSPGVANIVPLASRGLSGTALLSGLSLKSGTKYFAIVMCRSRSGVSVSVASDGVTVDTSPPTIGQVWDLCTNNCRSANDVDFTGSNTKLSLRWSGFSDTEGGIKQYDWNYAYCGNVILLHASDFNAGLATQDIQSVALTTALKYCLQVKATNKAGLSSVAWSDGLLVDVTAPTHFFVVDGLSLSGDIDHQSSISEITATWSSPTDPQTNMAYLTVAAGSAPQGTEIQQPVNIGIGVNSHTLSGLFLKDLTEYYVTVCGYNFAGLSTCATTDGVLVDVTAPTKGIVLTGAPLLGHLYQANTSRLVARWSDFEDVHSDIAEFKVAIGVSSNHTSVQTFLSVGLSLSSVITNLNLKTGDTYVVTVEATNYAGDVESARSVGITIDSTPPAFQQKPSLTLKGNVATLSWPGVVDMESSIWYYRWSLGVSCPGNQLADYINTASSTTSSMTTVSLITGQTYYGTVVARNRAGLSNETCSNAVLYDGTPPNISMNKLKYLTNSTVIPCSWESVTDHESGVKNCTLAIVQTSSNVTLERQEIADITTSSGQDVLLPSPLKNGKQYQCRLTCTNGAGLSSTVLSPPAVLDLTPPLAGEVNISLYWPKATDLAFGLAPCIDKESGIADYSWSIGTLSDKQRYQIATSIGQSLSAAAQSLSMSHNSDVLITVTCRNGAGLTTSFSSANIRIDTSPPTPSKTISVMIDPADSSLTATWSAAEDAESGIRGYRWAIGVSAGGCQVRDFTNVDTALSAKCSNCKLKAGETYYVSVEAINKAMLHNMASSNSTPNAIVPSQTGIVTVDRIYIGESLIQMRCKGFSDTMTSAEVCSWTLNNVTAISTSTLQCNCHDCTFNMSLPSVKPEEDSTTQLTVDVECRNAVNRSSSHVANIDITAPKVGQLICRAFSSNASYLKASYSGLNDPQSSVRLEWSISSQGSGEIQPWTTDGIDLSSSTMQSERTTLQSGGLYNISARATNNAGLVSSAYCLVRVDTIAPQAGRVVDGLSTVDLTYTSVPTSISASWTGFQDMESGPLTYHWCIGQSPGSQDVMHCRSVGAAHHGSCLTCNMVPGTAYYTTVLATNKAGLSVNVSSDGITLDTTPPVAGRVFEGTESGDGDADYLYVSSSSPLTVFWRGFSDPESTILGCTIAITFKSNGSVIWQNHGLAAGAQSSTPNVTFPNGVVLVTNVSCQNGASLWSSAVSDGVVLDNSPPVSGNVSYSWVTTADGKSGLQIECHNFSDPESALAAFDIVLADSTSDMAVVILNRTKGNTTFNLPVSNLTLGTTYYVLAKAYNWVGLFSVGRSPTAVFDTTPPSIGFVSDGPINMGDVAFSNSTTLEAHWESIADPDSGIKTFWYAIGTTPGGTQVLDYIPKSLNTSASCQAPTCNVVSGQTYYTTVRAENNAGKIAWFKSDGVTVDTTTPAIVQISLNGKTGNEVLYATVSSVVNVTWGNATDPDSPIGGYSVCLSSVGALCNMRPWISVGSSAMHLKMSIPSTAVTSQSLLVHVRAENAAGLSSVSASSLISIDNSPPSNGKVIDGSGMVDVDCQEDYLPIAGQWSGFVDEESYISHYEWAIGSKPYLSDVHTWTSVGMQQSATLSSSILKARRDVVYVAVRAFNGAGLHAESVSDGVGLISSAGTGSSSEVSKFCVSFAGDRTP